MTRHGIRIHSTGERTETTELVPDPFELALSYPKFGETSF